MDHAPGDRVFAKIKGFSNWPARINPLPPDVPVPKGKLPVFFYGTYQVCFVPAKNIVPYEKFKEKWGKPKPNPQFMTALEEIEQNPGIFMLGQDPRAESFLLQFYDFKKGSSHSLRSEGAVNSQRSHSSTDTGENGSTSNSSKRQRNSGISSRESNSKGHVHNSRINSSSAQSGNRTEKRPRSRKCSDQTLSDLDSNEPEEKIRLTDTSSELSSRPDDDGSDMPHQTMSEIEEEEEEDEAEVNDHDDDDDNSKDTLVDHQTTQDSSDSIPNSTGELSLDQLQGQPNSLETDDASLGLSPNLSTERGHENREDRDARRLARKLQKKAEKKALKKAAKREAKRIAKENERAERRARREARRERKRLHKLERQRIADQKRSMDSASEMQSDQELYHSDVWGSGNEMVQVSEHETKTESDTGSQIKQEGSQDQSPINLAVSDSFPESSMDLINDDPLQSGHLMDSPVAEEIVMYEKTSPRSILPDSELEPLSNNEVEFEVEVEQQQGEETNQKNHHHRDCQALDSISDLSSGDEEDVRQPSKTPKPESPVEPPPSADDSRQNNHQHINKSDESSASADVKKTKRVEDVKPDVKSHDQSPANGDNDTAGNVGDHSDDVTLNKVRSSRNAILSSDSDSDSNLPRSRLKFKPSKSNVPASAKKASRQPKPSDSDEESDDAQASKRRKTSHKTKSSPEPQSVQSRKHASGTREKSTHSKTPTQSKPPPAAPKREQQTSTNSVDEVVTQLRHFCRDLKSSLIRGHENFQMAVQVLDQLRTVSVRLPQLAQAWELMDCIKKCRRYKLSSEVRDAANNTLRYFQNMQTNATKEELSQAQELITAYQNRVQASQEGEKPSSVSKPSSQELTTSASVNPKEPSPQQQPSSSPQKSNETMTVSLTADLDAKVDDVLSRIRATDERMAAAAASQRSDSLTRSLAPNSHSNSHQFSNSNYHPDSGRVIRDSAIAAATANMRGEEDEESVVSRVEQVAAYEAATDGLLRGAPTNVPPPPPPPKPPLPSGGRMSPSVDLDLDSRIQLLMTSSSNTKSSLSRSHKSHEPVHNKPPPVNKTDPKPSSSSSVLDSPDPLTSLPPALLAKRKIIADRLTASKAAAAASPSKPCHPVTSPLPLSNSSLDIIAQTTEALLKNSTKPTAVARMPSSQDDEIYNLLGV